MKYGSVCSGIEAASAAWHPLGWRASFLSEIEAFPRAVLKHHYPEVPLHGDFTTIRKDQYEPIDLLVGGTPCQSFSIAGLRGGLADDRGNLALEYLKLAQRTRPRWLVWENVPGVLSSAGGRDFGAILGGLVELGYGFAYRVLDAQYVRVDGFGRAVPQRRRRVFVVGHLGDWRRAAAVLFERESLSGNIAPRRQAGEGSSYNVAPCIAASGRGFERTGDTRGQDCLVPEVCGTLSDGAHMGGGLNGQDAYTGRIIPVSHSLRADGFDASEDGTGRGTPIVPVAFAQNQRDELREMQVAGALAAEPGMKQQTYLHTGWRVRRLTPTECERLQGFPDGYTDIPWRNKEHSPDGPRYKALGNSMAINAMR